MERSPVPYAVVDAFTSTPFKGNPAAVCLLEEERDDDWLLAVAREFNISETAFLIRAAAGEGRGNPSFHLRWFTPVVEVELCGHATLAAAHFLFSSGMVRGDVVEFLTRSGVLSAKKIDKVIGVEGGGALNGVGKGRVWIELDLPAISVTDCKSGDDLSIPKTLNGEAIVDMKMGVGHDFIVELSSGKVVTELLPDFDEIAKCPVQGGVIVTGLAPSGSEYDFYSRYFCPKFGINEDPVCGSAHCALVNYWSKKLGKCDFVAYQASPRGGVLDLHLDVKTQRVLMRGEAVTVMTGSLLG